jgi:hypothetical protein
MFFLLRMAFWLTVIFALLPAFVPHDNQPAQSAAVKFNAGDAFSAATATVSDLGQFCSRRPEACAIGAQAAAAVGASAQTGMKILLGYLQDRPSKGDANVARTGSSPATSHKPAQDAQFHDTAAINKSTGSASNIISRDTLQPGDLGPAWRGPRLSSGTNLHHPA